MIDVNVLLLGHLPKILLCVFFAAVLGVVVSNPTLFTKRHGRRHAITGFCYLLWLLLGAWEICTHSESVRHIVYDTVLGVMGVTLTLTAAMEFPHTGVVNVASGTLDEHATVTQGEMLEHSFYQGLNLVQILYLHALAPHMELHTRLLLALLATAPWAARGLFPVNRFSDNYTKADARSTWLVRLLYRVKKWQYVFYKHFLLHGLNASAAMLGLAALPLDWGFRAYWLLLNASYVMEFFLQTLVKKRRLSQTAMLGLQKVLMAASSLAAARVLAQVNLWVSLGSLALNFAHRGHDVLNTALLLAAIYLRALCI